MLLVASSTLLQSVFGREWVEWQELAPFGWMCCRRPCIITSSLASHGWRVLLFFLIEVSGGLSGIAAWSYVGLDGIFCGILCGSV